MTGFSRPQNAAFAATALWTGRADVELKNGRGQWVGTVDVVVRLDNVSLWFGNRTLAVMDRDTFREWLIHPAAPMAVDDVVWVMLGSITCLTIDDSTPYAVSEATVKNLISVI